MWKPLPEPNSPPGPSALAGGVSVPHPHEFEEMTILIACSGWFGDHNGARDEEDFLLVIEMSLSCLLAISL